MANLTGQSVSQLSEFTASNAVKKSDSFFVSQPVAQVSGYTDYTSMALSYDELVRQLFSDLSAAFGFGSMAYELSDDYSRAQHGHDFNAFDAESSMQLEFPEQDVVTLATIRVGDKKVRIRQPRQWAYLAPEPVVGELKFKMLPSIADPGAININSPGFDGWVYPRGQSYSVSPLDFAEAKTCFGQEPAAETLTVPDMRGKFIKAVVPTAAASTARLVDYRNTGVPYHTHKSDIMLKGGSAAVQVKAEATKNAGPGGSVHNGSSPYRNKKYYEPQITLAAKSLEVSPGSAVILQSESSLAREQYPSFNYLPVMIYIGKKQ